MATGAPGLVRDARGWWFTAAMVWVLIVYLVVPINYLTGTPAAAEIMGAGNPAARAIKLGLLGLSSVIVMWRISLAWALLRLLNPFFLLFLALVPLSVLWSIDPTATLARYVSIIAIVQVAFAFTLIGWHPTRFQDVVRPIITLLLAASLLFGYLYPDLGIETGEGTLHNAWRGLASQKNQFGELSSFGVLFWLHALLTRQRKWWIAAAGLAIAGAGVFLSRSSTSLLSTVLVILFMLLMLRTAPNLRRYMPYIVGSFAVLVVVYALALLNIIPGMNVLLSPITALAGKDLTFSNRSQIWDIIKQHIELSPLFGSGYGAYWTGPLPSSPSYIFERLMYFYPSESHNGYLEIVNDLGFVGLMCLLGYLTVFVRQSLRLMRVDRGQGALFLGIFFQQAITNLSESTWLAINSAFAIAVVTAATFALARSLLDEQLKYMTAATRPAAGIRRKYGAIK